MALLATRGKLMVLPPASSTSSAWLPTISTRDTCPADHLTTVALEPAHYLAINRANAACGAVDDAGMAIRTPHAGIDDWCEIRWHYRPAEPFHVNELEPMGIVDVLAGHIANVAGSQRASSSQASAALKNTLGR